MSSWRALPIGRKLAVLITGVITLTLLSALVLAYVTLTRLSEIEASRRLAGAARALAGSADDAAMVRMAELLRLARTDTLRRAVAGDPGALVSARRSFARIALTARGDTLPVELWAADGKRVGFVGRDLGEGAPAASGDGIPIPRRGLAHVRRTDSAAYGRYHPEDSSAVYWLVAAVRDDERAVGWIAQQLRVGGPPGAMQAIRDFTGEDVRMLVHDDSLWVEFNRPTVPRVWGDSVGAGRYLTAPAGRMIAAEARIDRFGWRMAVETPVRAIHARTEGVLLSLAGLGLLLVAVGSVVSWVLGRRIARPIASLTVAAEAIAHGDYARRVTHDGGDEVGRLAASFNRMAAEVDLAHTALEGRLEEVRATAAQLEHSNAQLQHAMAEAERAREQAQQASRAKSDFLAVMSHELRTPLNAIGGYTQLLDLEVHGPVTAAQRDALSRIARSQAHLLRLINDVLNFARVDAGHVSYHMSDVPLDETLAGIEMLVSPQLRAKGLAFAYHGCDAGVTVRADEDKLKQVVINLLSNAIKFTPEGGRITVRCDVDADAVRVHVADSGVGIPAERLASIFDPFVQVERTARGPSDGVGLGLAISRDLARGMGGDLTVESAVGAGSTFTLTLRRDAGDA